jgi:hypothetical protein
MIPDIRDAIQREKTAENITTKQVTSLTNFRYREWRMYAWANVLNHVQDSDDDEYDFSTHPFVPRYFIYDNIKINFFQIIYI